MTNATPPAGLRRLFSLQDDQAAPAAIDAAIRDAVRIGGTNLWVLIFAIVIASVGLNVNATAAIIGAMLISPLMGPIIGIGYGVGIRDFALIRRALRNLAVFAAISLAVSTLYFLVTPLRDAQSELLARTTPNLWDVLIAFFGGAAGMVGLTRKEKSTTIPGVAIATALMPPLCTAGYGVATGQLAFVAGALYLFTINGVFIALATLAVTRILRLPLHGFENEAARRRGRALIVLIVAATLVPSVYLAAQFVRQQVFQSEANRYIDALVAAERDLVVADREVDLARRRIRLALVGGEPDAAVRQRLTERLRDYRLTGAQLDLHVADLGRARQTAPPGAAGAERRRALDEESQRQRALAAADSRLGEELRALQPGVGRVVVARTAAAEGNGNGAGPTLVVIDVAKPLALLDHKRLVRWLQVRLPGASIELVVRRAAPAR